MNHQNTLRAGPSAVPPGVLALGVLGLLALGAACHDSSGSKTTLTSDLTSTEARQGTTVEIQYVLKKVSGFETADIIADADGDLTTTDDQVVIDLARAVANWKTEKLQWDTTFTPADTYDLYVRLDNGVRQRVYLLAKDFKVNAPPVVTLLSPNRETVAYQGGVVEIRYRDDDPDDVATTAVFADADGDLATTLDQFELSRLPDADGGENLVRWDTTGVPLGTYWIVTESVDTIPIPIVERGPARIELAELYALHLGSICTVDPGRIGGAVQGNAVHASRLGGSYVAGSYHDALTTDGCTTLVATNPMPYDCDAFLARFDEHGELVWVRSSRSTQSNNGFIALATDLAPVGHDDLLVTGCYRGIKAFEDTVLESSLSYPSGAEPTEDVFLARYSADGELVWVASAGGPGKDRAHAVIGLPDGAAIVAGSFNEAMMFDANGPNQVVLRSAGLFRDSRDVFLARYEADGSLAWAQRAGGTDDDELGGLDVLSDGSILVTGSFRGTAGFGDARSGLELTSLGGTDVFVAHYAADGTLLTADRFGGPDNVTGNAIAAFDDDSFVVVGQANGDLDFQIGPMQGPWQDPFLARFDAIGDLAWSRTVEASRGGTANGVTTTPDGGLIVTGHFEGAVDFGTGKVLWALNTKGSSEPDAFFARFESDGTPAWARAGGGVGEDSGLDVSAWDDGSSIATGTMKQRARFHMGLRKESLGCYGSQDCFVYAMDAQCAEAVPTGGSSKWAGDHELHPAPSRSQ